MVLLVLLSASTGRSFAPWGPSQRDQGRVKISLPAAGPPAPTAATAAAGPPIGALERFLPGAQADISPGAPAETFSEPSAAAPAVGGPGSGAEEAEEGAVEEEAEEDEDEEEAVHLHVLVHGLAGRADDLAYLAERLEGAAAPSGAGAAVAVLRVRANEGRTTDGVERGAARVAREVLDFVGAFQGEQGGDDGGATGAFPSGGPRSPRPPRRRRRRRRRLATISFVGHSLGGLYARRAAALLFDGARGTVAGLAPASFMTVATPHLGVRRFTYVPTGWVRRRRSGQG